MQFSASEAGARYALPLVAIARRTAETFSSGEVSLSLERGSRASRSVGCADGLRPPELPPLLIAVI